MPDPEKVAAIRELLPATGAGIYLNAGTAGPIPSESQAAMDEQAARDLTVGRASPDQVDEIFQRWAELRASIAAVIVADPDDIAITHSTTDGMNLAINALPWREGDRVLTTNHEHPGALGPLIGLERRRGGAGGLDCRVLQRVHGRGRSVRWRFAVPIARGPGRKSPRRPDLAGFMHDRPRRRACGMCPNAQYSPPGKGWRKRLWRKPCPAIATKARRRTSARATGARE
jgi:hypothetical protein